MESRLAAYRILISLSSDGGISEKEQAILERYRRALRLPATALQDVRRRPADLETLPTGDRAHLLRMLARVAWVDGRFDPRERARLVDIAKKLEVGEIELAEIFVDAERNILYRRRTRRLVMVFGSLLLAGILATALQSFLNDAGKPKQDRIERLEAVVDELGREAARNDATRVRASWVGDDSTPFKTILAECRESVVLIMSEYVLRKDGRRQRRRGYGTGFFVSPDGHLATNKHVVQPWKFLPDIVKLIDDGWTLEPSTQILAAWAVGARALTDQRNVSLDTAWSSTRSSLKLVHTAPDRLQPDRRKLRNGRIYSSRFHIQDAKSDLAILQATLSQPTRPLPLRVGDPAVEKLDPIMVLGFPTGLAILEGGRAETSPALGEVRKVQDTIYVTAPIVGGNSGGPLIDTHGHVVGIATRTVGGATVGCCLLASHLLPLLPPAGHFVGAAEMAEKAGHPRAARAHLRLAGQRGPSAGERARIIALRAKLK
ncbi:MAG: hypothetical protein CMJ83_21530 [Planctomycetes bacterium]|nr:hypothetical protein [Planctomycetota bacterium]